MNTTTFTRCHNLDRLFVSGKTLACLAGLFLFAGHAQAADANKTSGSLEVFSSTQPSLWGEGSTYFLHTGYRIFDSTGKTVKWVENHSDSADESPEKVALAPGVYRIWAQSDQGGYVRLPVTVKAGVDTAIHLDRGHVDKKCVAME